MWVTYAMVGFILPHIQKQINLLFKIKTNTFWNVFRFGCCIPREQNDFPLYFSRKFKSIHRGSFISGMCHIFLYIFLLSFVRIYYKIYLYINRKIVFLVNLYFYRIEKMSDRNFSQKKVWCWKSFSLGETLQFSLKYSNHFKMISVVKEKLINYH